MWQGVRVGPAVLGVTVGNDPADTFDRRRGSCRRRRVFTGGLPGRVPPAAAASLGSVCELAPRRGHLRDSRPDKIDRRAIAAIFLGSLL